MRRLVPLAVVGLGFMLLLAGRHESTAREEVSASQNTRMQWYKGNTHTHTLNSDGDSTPDDVARWYREHGYQFLVLTDHNYLTSVDGLNALHGADNKFLVIKGEEVTDRFEKREIHINGLNVERLVQPQGGGSVIETVQRNVDAIRQAFGIPHINHPNFRWSITAEELQKVERYKLFEIFNGHPYVNNEGGGGVPSLEQMWDFLLFNGKLVYGIAVDDAHQFKRPWDRKAARPGQGWVMVRAESLAPRALFEAMEKGDFYASTGVELEDYRATDKMLVIRIKEEPSSKYRVQFIGKGENPYKGGRILKEEISSPATYEIRGDEGYVRAKVIDSNGNSAWTQPVMVGRR